MMSQHRRSQRCFLLLLLSLSFRISSAAISVIEDYKDVKVRGGEDETLVLTCTGSEPWQYCRWAFYGRSCGRTVDSTLSGCSIDDGGRISWRGVPSIDHACTIAVARPGGQDAGSWTCQLIRADNQVASKSYKVTVQSRASVAFAARPHMKMAVGAEYTVECESAGGVPAPQLVALVGPRPEVSAENDRALEPAGDIRADGVTVSRIFRYAPLLEDARSGRPLQQYLKCLATQPEDAYPPTSVSSDFEIVFPPLPNDVPLPTFYIDDVRATARVEIVFLANPAPRAAWHVVRQSSNMSSTIEAGQISGRYEAEQLETIAGTSGAFYRAVLTIHQASLEDTLDFCYLEATNVLGRFEYSFALAPMPPPTPAAPEVEGPGSEKDESQGKMEVGTIVGISVGCFLLLIAVGILLCFCVKTKKVCFADSSKGATANDGGGGGDTYATDEQRDNETRNDPLLYGGESGGESGGVANGRGRESYNRATHSRDSFG